MITVFVHQLLEFAKLEVRNCEDELPLGHVFTEFIQWDEGPLGESVAEREVRYSKPSRVISSTPVNLKLIRIWCFGRLLPTLDPGYGGVLTVEGSGYEVIKVCGGLR